MIILYILFKIYVLIYVYVHLLIHLNVNIYNLIYIIFCVYVFFFTSACNLTACGLAMVSLAINSWEHYGSSDHHSIRQ